ncbi:prepilin peptidase [Microbacterium testaceum]|uniref:prepilin peptidase n=1 Tax=Microbacterium testaceum TaxID=2033 RepID=UPI002AC700CC|nr:prepilin peptidase [Microbacterium testaceum]MDZ5146335.1 prepilin peptidase [Microbacterium testaceum]
MTAIVLAASLALSLVDEATLTLPNRYVAALAVFAASQVAAASLLQHSIELALSAVAASAIVAGIYAVFAIVGWVGFGDTKFAAVLALVVAVVAGMFAAYIPVLAILISWARILFRRFRRRPDQHPHGLSLAIASIVVMLLFI